MRDSHTVVKKYISQWDPVHLLLISLEGSILQSFSTKSQQGYRHRHCADTEHCSGLPFSSTNFLPAPHWPYPLATTNLFSIYISMAFQDWVVQVWSHSKHPLGWLSTLSRIPCRFPQVLASHGPDLPHFSTHSPTEGHLSHFHFVAVKNKASLKAPVQSLVWIYATNLGAKPHHLICLYLS